MKLKRDPLPMKSRAFPQSFWQQPNKTQIVSPATVYYDDEQKQETIESKEAREVVTRPDIDLLFSLFRNVNGAKRSRSSNPRGRPKRSPGRFKIVRDDDPYLTESCLHLLAEVADAEEIKKRFGNCAEVA
ncbi:hypothetical protein PPYR_12378 [Photinus pyralis]|uniref:Uncharacterized protein n=1 Tax=Photinus pyralis TaxID=7054 RepID=A0A5N4AE16_PHOPY|nr:hypothetical protein PPYR_12378 [Photinus pyralis]